MISTLFRSTIPLTRSGTSVSFRSYSQPAGTRPLIGRYDRLPTELARVQSGKKVSLRDYETQRAEKRYSYDLKLVNGLVMPAKGPNFIGMLFENGMIED
jgi:hypothetical protein